MWIGSNVPPRIPVRTPARIGHRGFQQPESPRDVGARTADVPGRIDVAAADPHRHVHTRSPVRGARAADRLTPGPLLAGGHEHPGQIRDGNLEAGRRLDGHGSHPGDGAGEGHHARCRRRDDGPHGCAVVDTPMARVLPHRCVPGNDRACDRWRETYGCDCELNRQHLSPRRRTYTGSSRTGRTFVPAPTADRSLTSVFERSSLTATRIGLMGFGRIGRNVFRHLHGRDDLEVVAIHATADPEGLTYLLRYDSLYGRFPGQVSYADGFLDYDGRKVRFGSAQTPADANWAEDEVDIVFETTSRYRSRETLQGHLDNGAKRVVLTSSPEVPGEIPLLIRG